MRKLNYFLSEKQTWECDYRRSICTAVFIAILELSLVICLQFGISWIAWKTKLIDDRSIDQFNSIPKTMMDDYGDVSLIWSNHRFGSHIEPDIFPFLRNSRYAMHTPNSPMSWNWPPSYTRNHWTTNWWNPFHFSQIPSAHSLSIRTMGNLKP